MEKLHLLSLVAGAICYFDELIDFMVNSYQNTPDSELYKFLSGSNQEKEMAFREIYKRHSQKVYAYCRRVVGNRDMAEDLFQETFLRLLQSCDANKEMINLSGYIIKIARNLCLKQKSHQAEFVSLEDFEIKVEENVLERTEITNIITMALELLGDDYREALVLQTYDELSYNEIAEIQGVPLTTVRNRIVRAKQKLREIVQPYLADTKN
ncbi:MAG: RNA polymerase sigma factor [Ignavibacteriae bacterium]|nr:RNA polymerase sigma factor [Ignavibacteriota bacterium]